MWTAFCGELEASRGDVERGRELCRSTRALAEDIGHRITALWVWSASMEVELLVGDLATAEAFARENLERCERMGTRWPDMWRVEVARVLLEQERIDEAEWMLNAVEHADPGDAAFDSAVRAPLLARRGDFGEAERLARAAVELSEATDVLPFKTAALRALGDVLARAGKREEAADALRRALTLEEERGATVPAERTKRMLAALRARS